MCLKEGLRYIRFSRILGIKMTVRMSAFGYKRTLSTSIGNVRFTPVSRHSDAPKGGTQKADIQCPLTPQQRT